jgi:hypothetical protein
LARRASDSGEWSCCWVWPSRIVARDRPPRQAGPRPFAGSGCPGYVEWPRTRHQTCCSRGSRSPAVGWDGSGCRVRAESVADISRVVGGVGGWLGGWGGGGGGGGGGVGGMGGTDVKRMCRRSAGDRLLYDLHGSRSASRAACAPHRCADRTSWRYEETRACSARGRREAAWADVEHVQSRCQRRTKCSGDPWTGSCLLQGYRAIVQAAVRREWQLYRPLLRGRSSSDLGMRTAESSGRTDVGQGLATNLHQQRALGSAAVSVYDMHQPE